MVAVNLGWAYAMAGRLADARSRFEQVLELTREFRTGLAFELFAGAGLAYVLLAEADPEDALRVCDTAIGATQGHVFEESVAHLVRVHVLAALGGFEEAEASLARAATLARDMQARALEPFLHEARARLALARGDDLGALDELRAAHALFAELGATGQVARYSALSG
jgi:ATP/maltotriose-dependent transcriptional regulator MalT